LKCKLTTFLNIKQNEGEKECKKEKEKEKTWLKKFNNDGDGSIRRKKH